MTITIEISAEEEARLRERARRQGENAEAVARAFLRAGLAATPTEGAEAARDAFLQHLLGQDDIPTFLQGVPARRPAWFPSGARRSPKFLSANGDEPPWRSCF